MISMKNIIIRILWKVFDFSGNGSEVRWAVG